MIRPVERAGGKVFQVYGRRNGKQVYVTTCGSKKEAEAAERRFQVDSDKIAAGELAPEHDTKLTLSDAIDRWLEALDASEARSRRAYGEFVKYQIKPPLGSSLVASMRKAHVTRWRDNLLAQYSATTINSALGCLSSACSWLVEQGLIPANPCHGVKPLELKVHSYNWIRTRGELERLLAHCADDLRDIVAIAVGTGMRIDELMHLQWDDIDLDHRLITVQRGRQGLPKGGRIRHVPILDSVLPVLEKRALRRAGSVLVFPGKDGAVRAKSPVQVAFKQALKRAGLDTSVRFHDLRHTCASWWVLAGGDIFRLSRMLGHADVRITQRTYAHLAPEAWQQDYGRIAFHVPDEPGKVYEIVRDANGKLAGRRTLTHAAS
jgi:integrase